LTAHSLEDAMRLPFLPARNLPAAAVAALVFVSLTCAATAVRSSAHHESDWMAA
jgi:hypothetical protein